MGACRLALPGMLLLAACSAAPAPTTPPPEETRHDGPGCPDDPALFEERLWGPVLRARCLACHVEGGVAGGTRLCS